MLCRTSETGPEPTALKWLRNNLQPVIHAALRRVDAAMPGDDPRIRQDFIRVIAVLQGALVELAKPI
jgi:hypothetical protein